jgi:cell division protein FtsB
MESNEKGTVSKKIFFATIILLVLVNCGTLYLLYSTSAQKTDVTVQKTALEKDFRNLSDTLDVKREALNQYMGKNDELDKTIQDNQAMIDREKKQIAGLLHKNNLTAAELSKAKGMIAMYEASIADMTKQIGDLTAQNHALDNQNHDLAQNLDQERVNSAHLTDVNKGLSQKVEAGSLLQLAKVDVEAIKKRHSGKEVAVKRVKAAEELKISFETGGNKVLDPGTLSLYVRIINPKGETIAVADQGSGTIPSADSQTPVQYSKKADINWDQTSKKVVVYWNQNISDPGTYKVQVYQKGYVVGEGAVKLI